MRCQEDLNTEHKMKSICRAAVAQWTTRLTRTGQNTSSNPRGAHFWILHEYTVVLYCTRSSWYLYVLYSYLTCRRKHKKWETMLHGMQVYHSMVHLISYFVFNTFHWTASHSLNSDSLFWERWELSYDVIVFERNNILLKAVPTRRMHFRIASLLVALLRTLVFSVLDQFSND